MVRIFFGSFQVFLISCNMISIGIHFIHSSMLHIENLLHLSFAEAGSNINSPIAKFQKQGPGLFVFSIHPRIS